MLLRNRPPAIDAGFVHRREGFEHLDHTSLVILRWLNANKIDYVLVGAVGRAVRGDTVTKGPVAIVPAPYGRNYDRLARALTAERAGLRAEPGMSVVGEPDESVPVKLTGEKLARGRHWKLRFGDYALDVDSAGPPAAAEPGAPQAPGGSRSIGATGARYQELLYEANRFTVADEVTVEVASPEDLEHYAHMRRTGSPPEFRVTRGAPAEAPERAVGETGTGAEAAEAAVGEKGPAAESPEAPGESSEAPRESSEPPGESSEPPAGDQGTAQAQSAEAGAPGRQGGASRG